MAISNPTSADLSRYSVGEITQLVGPNVFYNAGASKWLRTGSYTAATNLGTAAKNNLAAGSTYNDINIALLSQVESTLYSAYPYMPVSPQRISSAGVTVMPACSGTSTPLVTVVTSAGAQNISLPMTTAQTSGSAGASICVASNNTTIFAYSPTATATLGAVSTTDGLNWSSVSLTGLPTFTGINTSKAYGSGSSSDCQTGSVGRGTGGTNRFSVFWCGARFILVIADAGAGVMYTSTSTNGIAWSGDTTNAVLGKTGDTYLSHVSFYKNGNSCYLNVNDCQRYTTDGGVTWASCTGMTYTNAATYRQKVNASLPAKLFYHDKSTGSLFSADSGATWTARTLPGNGGNATAGLAYRGSTVLLANSNNIVYRSVDDGANWVSVTFPAGTLNSGGAVYADANRFYFCPAAQGQVLTSTDGITWTIVSVPANYFYITSNFGGIIAFDSNNVVLLGYNSSSGYDICALTNDGGVTWKNTTVNYISPTSVTNSYAGDAFVSPDGLGGGTTAFGGNNGGGYYGGTPGNVCSKQTAVAGGGFYRSGSTAVTPTNANATVYTRVE